MLKLVEDSENTVPCAEINEIKLNVKTSEMKIIDFVFLYSAILFGNCHP